MPENKHGDVDQVQPETEVGETVEEMSDEELDLVNGGASRHRSTKSGAEVSMIELQSVVSKRATALQLTTNMMASINDGTKSIADNIGH